MKILSTLIISNLLIIQASQGSLTTNITSVVRGTSTTQTTTYTRSTNYVCEIIQVDSNSDGEWDHGVQVVKVDGKEAFRYMKFSDKNEFKIQPSSDLLTFITQNSTNGTIEQITIHTKDYKFGDVLNLSTNGYYLPSTEEEMQKIMAETFSAELE